MSYSWYRHRTHADTELTATAKCSDSIQCRTERVSELSDGQSKPATYHEIDVRHKSSVRARPRDGHLKHDVHPAEHAPQEGGEKEERQPTSAKMELAICR
jgi:hypothetical protein